MSIHRLNLAKLPDQVRINVFIGEHCQGSTQQLNFVSSPDLLETDYLDHLESGIDYSIVYFDKQSCAKVIWQNHQGQIQFCGSAAYALSWYIAQHYSIQLLRIQAPHIELTANFEKDIVLEIPASKENINYIGELKNKPLLYHRESGIYFIEYSSQDEVITFSGERSSVLQLPLMDAHGVCAFYWNDRKCIGYLRYFTPWHGRDEDSVTGSIQRYLSPYVMDKYKKSQQTWHQLSNSKGILTTSVTDKILLSGECTI